MLRELRQAMELACDALVRFDLPAFNEQMEQQQRLTGGVRRWMAECGTRALPGTLGRAMRELQLLNRVQRALLTGGSRAIQLEINLAQMARAKRAAAGRD